jgi:hypothetical protein
MLTALTMAVMSPGPVLGNAPEGGVVLADGVELLLELPLEVLPVLVEPEALELLGGGVVLEFGFSVEPPSTLGALVPPFVVCVATGFFFLVWSRMVWYAQRPVKKSARTINAAPTNVKMANSHALPA